MVRIDTVLILQNYFLYQPLVLVMIVLHQQLLYKILEYMKQLLLMLMFMKKMTLV